jgi:hypothetical protein
VNVKHVATIGVSLKAHFNGTPMLVLALVESFCVRRDAWRRKNKCRDAWQLVAIVELYEIEVLVQTTSVDTTVGVG